VELARKALVYALGYGAAALLRTLDGSWHPGLLGHWQLDRKLRECFTGLDLNGDESARVVDIIQTVLGRVGRTEAAQSSLEVAKPEVSQSSLEVAKPEVSQSSLEVAKPKVSQSSLEVAKPEVSQAGGAATAKTSGAKAGMKAAAATPVVASAKAWAAVLIAENYQADDFRRILGINHFNDVTWFNKESFEESTFYLSLFMLAEDDAAFSPAFIASAGLGAKRAAFIAEFVRVMFEAEEQSGYRLDELIKGLAAI
jgi:hypothetical protein